jgi:peptidoglycan L-alanyl-D-glutamate endopeptidase CwlK
MGNILKKENLKGIDPRLSYVVERAISLLPFDVFVVEGIRTLERQQLLVASGKSRTLNSKHITGKAVDLAPYKDGKILWDNKYKPLFKGIKKAMLAVAKENGLKIRSGSDWDMNGTVDEEELKAYKAKFGRFPLVDYPHYELV